MADQTTGATSQNGGANSLMLAQAKNLVAGIGNLYKALNQAFPIQAAGTLTLAAAASTTVTGNSAISSETVGIALFPTNASAATLQGSAKSLYVSAITTGGFTVSTASGGNAAGTETFFWFAVNL